MSSPNLEVPNPMNTTSAIGGSSPETKGKQRISVGSSLSPNPGKKQEKKPGIFASFANLRRRKTGTSDQASDEQTAPAEGEEKAAVVSAGDLITKHGMSAGGNYSIASTGNLPRTALDMADPPERHSVTSLDEGPSTDSSPNVLGLRQRLSSTSSGRLRQSSTNEDGEPANFDADFLNTTYLAMIRDRVASTEAKGSDEQLDKVNPVVEDLAEMDDFYIDPYSRQFLMPEILKQKHQPQNSPSVQDIQKVDLNPESILPFQLPLPSAQGSPGKGERAKWSAPESWNVTQPEISAQSGDAAKVSIQKAKGEVMSCIRVFRREGNFVTVSCALNVSSKDLCTTLARKFFIVPEAAAKYQLWVLRNGRETLIGPNDKPLQLQQRWLWELGYDPSNDRFQDILREDNSIFYRWIYSDSSVYSTVNSQMVAAGFDQDNMYMNFVPRNTVEKKLLDLCKLQFGEVSQSIKIDLSECNLDSIPVILFKYANLLNSLDLSGNLIVRLPQDFVALCGNLRCLKLTHFDLQSVPTAVQFAVTLETLDVSHNNIISLRGSGLQQLKNLKRLVLANNRLIGRNALPQEIVTSWKALETLDLSCNWFKGELPRSIILIGQDATASNTSLLSMRELHLSYNHLTSLPADIDQHYPNLEKLSLVSNYLNKLPDGLKSLSKLVSIDVRGNHILRSIEPLIGIDTTLLMSDGTSAESTSNEKKLERLLLDHNQIGEIKISRSLNALKSVISHRNPNLLQLFFSAALPALTTLIASASKLAFLPDDIFQFTPNLEVLILSNNQLTGLPPSIKHLRNLVRLEIANNAITKLAPTIKRLHSLEILDLHGNNLRDVPMEVWELGVKFLNLSSNVIEAWPEPTLFQNNTHADRRASYASTFSRTIPSQISNTNTYFAEDNDDLAANDGKMTDSGLMRVSVPSADKGRANQLMTSLTWFSIADNRIEANFFETAIAYMTNLRSLNVAHNEIFNVPHSTLKSSPELETLYLSGNHLTQLPEDIFSLKHLKCLYMNGNRLSSLPPELAKLSNLRVLDVGRNQLRYNVGNWPYDWNWNWNLELRYLNLSGNPRLEIRSQASRAETAAAAAASKKKSADENSQPEKDLVRFESLGRLRMLGLLEVPVYVPLPEESSTRRIRVYASGGTSAQWKKYMGLDSEIKEGATPGATSINIGPEGPIKSIVANDLNISPPLSFGISDGLDLGEKMNCWDLVLLGAKFLQSAREEVHKPATPGNENSFVEPDNSFSKGNKSNLGECIFALFESNTSNSSWCSKWLNDFFANRFGSELKKVFKERSALKAKIVKGEEDLKEIENREVANATDNDLIQHALRRTFLALNKYLGGLAYTTENKPLAKSPNAPSEAPAEFKTLTRKPARPADAPDTSTPRGRKASVSMSFDNSIYNLLGKKTKGSGAEEGQSTINRRQSGTTENGNESNMRLFVSQKPGKSIIDVYEQYEEAGGNTADSIKLKQNDPSKSLDLYDSPLPSVESYSLIGSEDKEQYENTDDAYMSLKENGYSGLIMYLVNSTLFVANCGESVAVLSRNGKAVPLSMEHTLFSTSISSNSTKSDGEKDNPIDKNKKAETNETEKKDADDVQKNSTKVINRYWGLARRELVRIRHTGGFISNDGLIFDHTLQTRSFGQFGFLPQVNSAPYVSLTELSDQDEFIIIGSASFWKTMTYQTAIDVARLKADDSLEASMVLRDFAMAYMSNAVYTVDENSESPEQKEAIRKANKRRGRPMNYADQNKRYLVQNPLSVMVINVKEWIGSKKKVFTKMKRRKDETVDSAIARLAPEVEPPTGFVTIVFTDVRNSTNIWERMSIPMRVAVREHNNIMRRNLRQFNGYEVKTEGDAFMVSFKNVLDALRWCMTCQLQLLEADWPQEILESPDGKEVYGPSSLENVDEKKTLLYRGLSIRMGLHCGNPVCEQDPVTRRMDYFGPMVNKTSRVCGAAEGGQILVSQDVERAYHRLKLASAKDDSERGSKSAKSAANEKISNLNLLDPQFIEVGERKLKGFDKPEPLIAVWPKAVLGRHIVPPPPLETAEKEKTVMELAENNEKEVLANPLKKSPMSKSAMMIDSAVPSIEFESSEKRRSLSELNAGTIIVGELQSKGQLTSPRITLISESTSLLPERDILVSSMVSLNAIDQIVPKVARLTERIGNLVKRRIADCIEGRENTPQHVGRILTDDDLKLLNDGAILTMLVNNESYGRKVIFHLVEGVERMVDALSLIHSGRLKKVLDECDPNTKKDMKQMIRMLLEMASSKTANN